MSVPSRDSSKKGTITRSQAKKNPILGEEIKESSQGLFKPKRKTREDIDKFSQYSEKSSALDQTDLLDINVGSISDPDTSAQNKSIIESKNPKSPFLDKLKTFIRPNNSIIIAGDKYNDTPQINQSFDDTTGDITLREESIFENIAANSTLYDKTLCPDQFSEISNDKIFSLPQKRYKSIDPFATKSQLNRTPESFNQTTIFKNPNLEFEQVQEILPYKSNQTIIDDSANIEQNLNSPKSSYPLSTSRKSDKEVSIHNLPNNLPSNLPNNLPTQPTEMNLPTNQQVSLRDALEIVPYFDGSNKVPLTIFIEACKEAKEMVPNAEANLIKLLRSKLTGEARRCISGNYYNNLDDFISKLKTFFAPSKTVYQLQGDLGRIYMWENESVLSYAIRIQEIAAEILECHKQNNNGKEAAEFERNLERDAIDCFLRGLKPEIEIRIGTASKFDEIVKRAIREERNLTARNELRRGNRQHSLFQEPEKSAYNNREFAKTNKINLAREEPIKCQICQKIGHTAATCFQYIQKITNKSLQGNQSRNNLNRENNQYEGNRQGQGNQWRPSQRYQMQNPNQQRGRNDYRDINIFPTHPNFSQGNRFNQNPNFIRNNQNMYRNPTQNNQSRNFNQNSNFNRNFNPNSNFNRNFIQGQNSNQSQNFNQGQNFNRGRNFNQNPYFNQRQNYNYNQNRNQNPNFDQNPNPGQNFELICYSCNTPGHTSRNCNKQFNMNQQLQQPPQQQQQQQQQEFDKQENSNALPRTGAQRRA